MSNKISVCAPMLNEHFFLPKWINGIKSFASEVVVSDGGSTDDSVDLLHQLCRDAGLALNFMSYPQVGRPYSKDWQESIVRNRLLSNCMYDNIFMLDIDEYMPESTVLDAMHALDTGFSACTFPIIIFWGSLDCIRISTAKDLHWSYIECIRAIKKGTWEYIGDHHCGLMNVSEMPQYRSVEFFYHLHYGFGKFGIKARDNRRGDMGPLDKDELLIEDPDFTLQYSPYVGEIVTKEFTKEIQIDR